MSHPDIDRLEQEHRFEEAGDLAEQRGLNARASSLFERALQFDRAALCALACSDLQRALLFAALGGNPSVVDRCVEAISASPDSSRACAELLRARGHARISGMVLERVGDLADAGRMYAAAGCPIDAARVFESAGELREAGRTLELAYRQAPQDEHVAVELGLLLTRAGKHEAAVRVLQAIAPSSTYRPRALGALVHCMGVLGMAGPRDQLMREAQALGVQLEAPPSASPPRDNEVVFGRYVVTRTAASTPSARVLEAVDRLTGERVAIKQVLSAAAVGAGRDAFDRLVREARALQQLSHPHVVPLVELIVEAAAIVTPWMPGGSLADLMQRARLVPSRAIEIACAVLGALAEAHRLGILHRDVKPSNILFDDSGTARLADFGAAHVSDASATATAGVIGTLAYMSPEQRMGQPATGASDVYGVGATLAEMLTGSPPGQAGELALLPSQVHPEMGPGHDQVMRSLVQPEVDRRPSGALVARDLLLSLAWPSVLRGPSLARAAPVQQVADCSRRLLPVSGAVYRDEWIGREILVVPFDAVFVKVAQAYCGEPGGVVSAVLRVDVDAGQIWFDAPKGLPLSRSGLELTSTQRAVLDAGLRYLHACGVTHGAVDAEHVFLHEGEVTLVLEPACAMKSAPAQDLEQLRAI